MRIPSLVAGSALLASTLSPALGQTAKALYDQNCASCHAADGTGGGAGAQSLMDTKREWLGGKSHRDLFNSVKDGLKENGMPAFGAGGAMSDAEIWSTIVYIREMQAAAARKAGPGRIPAKNADGVAETQYVKYKMEDVIAKGLDTPWSIAWLPDGTMLITERPGGLRTFKDGVLSERVKGTPEVLARGQGGMLEVVPHPDYAKNGWIYLTFSHPMPKEGTKGTPAMTRVVRGKIKDGAWVDQEVIWKADDAAYVRSDIHFGSKMVFEKSKEAGRYYLYFTHGERGFGDRAQDLTLPNGKVHRVWDDGTIPADNPFVDVKDAVKSVWSYGHRNLQGLTLDLDGRLMETEHGPRGGDEVNIIEKGHNYGWPIVTFGMDYPGMFFRQRFQGRTIDLVPFPDLVLEINKPKDPITMPIHVWLPSIAASGFACVQGGPAGEAFPMWKGDLFAGGQAGNTVRRLRIKDGVVLEHEEILYGYGRVRDVRCGPEGALYLALNDPHKIVRLVPAK